MENNKRPAKDETDEDLLKEQELFLREKSRPSVQFVSKNKNSKEISGSNEENLVESQESYSKTDQNVTDIKADDILFNVQERDVSFSEPFVFQPTQVNPEKITDIIKKDVKMSKFASRRKKESIFLQMLNASGEKSKSNEPKRSEDLPSSMEESHPLLIDGSGLASDMEKDEVKKIHEENLAKLSAMSKEEIIQNQEQLKNYLKPEILNFIKQRKLAKRDGCSKSNSKPRNTLNKDSMKNEQDIPGEILRKEGNNECDALILEKAISSESKEYIFEKENIVDNSKKDEKKDFEIPEEAKELIEGDSKGLWRNMSKIEKEKLEWMTNLPQPKPVNLKTGYTARFDFEGKLLSREADIPMYKGLHHHGQEPEVAGYSLEELFLLARSSLQSQRITALNTLAHILENNWCGVMDTCFESPLLPMLLNAGIVPLLRWALDDTSLTSVAATITAIHSLLISKADEACLYKTFCWLNGHFIPQLEPQGLDEPNIVIEELTDADLIKLDVVKGFLRIDILPRFLYILKVMCPPPLVCKLMIEICARLAQHSKESALQVAEHPGFLKLIFEKFLPENWHFVDASTLTDTVNYQCPMHSALKLVRIIAASSKELATTLVLNYHIISKIYVYLTIQPMDGKLPAQDVQFLAIEALKLWHSLLCYGLAYDIFLNLVPILLKQLDFCLSLNLNCDLTKHIKDFDYATHLFKCFEAVAVIAAENQDEKNTSVVVSQMFYKAIVCLKKWIWQFSQDKTTTHQMTLLAACMNFIVTYCRKSHEGLTCKAWEPCSAAKDVFENYLIPSIKSNVFQSLLEKFRSFSLVLTPDINGNKRDGKTIVSLGSVLYGEDVVPILKEGTPLPLFSAVLNYILLYKNFFHDVGNECLDILFCSSVYDYLKAISSKELKSSCWFLKFETFYIYQLIELSSFAVSPESSICHETAVSILSAFTIPEESLVENLFENIIINQDIILKVTSLSKYPNNPNEKNDLHTLLPRLPVIAQCYTSCFLNEQAALKSRNLLFRSTELESLFCLSTPHSLVSKDWCFMPIYYLYQKLKQRNRGESLSPEETLEVISSLQWIYTCHILNLPVLKKMPASAEFYYLYMTFLIDEDLFRDEKIKTFLINCATIILKQKKLNLSKINWNGIKNFDDLYLELLIQYEAVSYGDETFGSFLLLPLQQNCPRQWKKLLLTEHSSSLSFLRVPFTKLLVPVQNFLEPAETDMGVLSEYFKALASGNLNHKRCPLVYLMAVHHIHNFIFMKSDVHLKAQKILLNNVLRARKDLKKNILLYSKVDESLEYGFCLSEKLSSENEIHISNIMG